MLNKLFVVTFVGILKQKLQAMNKAINKSKHLHCTIPAFYRHSTLSTMVFAYISGQRMCGIPIMKSIYNLQDYLREDEETLSSESAAQMYYRQLLDLRRLRRGGEELVDENKFFKLTAQKDGSKKLEIIQIDLFEAECERLNAD